MSPVTDLDVSRLEGEFPRKVYFEGPPPQGASEEAGDIYALSYLCNEVTSTEETLGLEVVSACLFDQPNGPVYKALIESGLANSFCPGAGFDRFAKLTSFTIGVSNVRPTPELREAIEDALRRVVRDGLDGELVESVLHQIELGVRRPKANQGFSLLMGMISFIVQRSSLENYLRVDENIESLRRKITSERYLEGLIERYLIRNERRVEVHMGTNANYHKELQQREQDRLREAEARLTPSERGEILALQQQLKENQESVQDVSVLPTLNESDIRRDVEFVEVEPRSIQGVESVFVPQNTNGL